MDLSFYREIARNITNQSLLTFKKEASASLQAFIDRKQRNMSLIYDLFLSRVLYYRDIIEDLQGKTLYDFEYLVQPKFSIESKKTPLKPLDDVNYEAFIDDISMISLDYKLKYGWEITQIDPYFIFTPSIPRIFFNFIMNINLNKGILLKNSQEIPYIALGALLARPLIVLDPISLEKPLEMIEKGINSEFWILIRLDKQDYGFLTKIAYIFKEITEKQKVLGILLKGIELNDSIIEIPRSFTEQFRSITIKEWHLSKIIETRLFIIGISFEKAQRISKKMLLLYHILTNSFENQYIMMGNLQNKQDFIETKKSLLGKSIINEKLLLKALEGVNIDFSSIENQLKQSIKALLKGNILKSVLKPLLSLVFNEETVYSKGEIPLKENFMDCIKDYLKRKDREMVRKGVISNLQRAYESFQQEKSFIIAGRTNIGKIALIKMTMAIFNDLQGNFN